MKKRTSGILLHITSLPGPYGIGDFGSEAYRFADFLCMARQSYWQILPLNPPQSISSISPYNCLSAFAGNTTLISPRLLYELGYLKKQDIDDVTGFPEAAVDYKRASKFRAKIFNKLTINFKDKKKKETYHKFCRDNKSWLDNHALFIGLSQHFKTTDWSKWPKQIRDRKQYALKEAGETVKMFLQKEKLLQYIFFEQWFLLKKYCNGQGISIIGDMPIYVAYRSADVWANQKIFKLDKSKKPAFISGVPPDLFSNTGQLWGNPVYKWQTIKRGGYRWWLERIRLNLKLYDIIRIDHFRGLVNFWQVPAGHKTAVKGKWVKGPGEDFFKTLYKYFPSAQIIAEDLGYITEDVREVVNNLQLPGMKVLLFAFDDLSGKNPYLPHNHIKNCVVYTGTHDNNTIKGWFEKEATVRQKKALFAYLGRKLPTEELPTELIRLAMASVARTIVIPMQDVLGLGKETRMNRPAKRRGNWKWRLWRGQISKQQAIQLAKMTKIYGRA